MNGQFVDGKAKAITEGAQHFSARGGFLFYV
jgi:hypothetical protein